jgi:hypothetical protein
MDLVGKMEKIHGEMKLEVFLNKQSGETSQK